MINFSSLKGRPARLARPLAALLGLLLALAGAAHAQVSTLNEHFDTAPPATWNVQNLSNPVGTRTWSQGNTAEFAPQATAGYIAANYETTTGAGDISSWLLTPQLTLTNGSTLSFWTRTSTEAPFPDRLQVRLSTAGTSTNVGTTSTSVGDFTTLLFDINPTLTLTGYPIIWRQYTATISGLPAPTTGRVAFRYFVTNGGINGANSNYIGLDEVAYQAVAVAAPTLTQLNPTSGPVGTSVTLTGTNLTGATGVRFNGTAATTFAVVNATTATATVPAGATSGLVTVTTLGGTSNGLAFAVTVVPTVSTATPGSITATSAVLGGAVTADGNAAVTERGVVYSSTNNNPTIGAAGVTQDINGMGTGNFSKTIPGLAANTTYYVRAYATNNAGTSYGSPLSFTTPAAPTSVVSINRAGSNPTNAASVSYTVTFAASVTGLSASNFGLVATGGVAGASITGVSGSGTTYTVAVSTGTGDGTLGLNLTTAAGLSPGLSNALPFVGQVYTIDKTAPTVTITSPTAPDGGYTTTAPLTYVLTFSEEVSSPTVSVTNFGGGSLTRTSTSTFAVSVTPGGPGSVRLTVNGNTAADAAGNASPVAFYTIFYNVPTTTPVLTSPANNSTLASGLPTYAGTAPAGSTVTVYVNGTSIGTTTASGSTGTGSFSLAQPTVLPAGTYAVYATALATGQTVSANSATISFTVDTVQPTVAISSTAGTSGGTTGISPIPFTVTFSENVTGFVQGGLSVTNGSVSGFSGSGTTYTFTVTPTTAGTATTVTIAANAAQDAAGNGSQASPTYALTVSSPPLPVELTAFTATLASPRTVRLAWATASEKNSARFEVERSPDGVAFARIGTVAAAGSSTTALTYGHLDDKLPAGTAQFYYRLRQVDLDGTSSYSPVRPVSLMGGAASFALFPNPAHGGTATLTGATPGTVVTVYDALGRPVASATADAAGTAALVLLRGLATGVYVVRNGPTALRLVVE